jgi:hypothetical protein
MGLTLREEVAGGRRHEKMRLPPKPSSRKELAV